MKAVLIIELGLAEVEARWESGVFSGVVAVNVETTFALGPGPTDGATDCANTDTIRLRWGLKSSGGECWIAKSRITCDNTIRNTTLSEAQGVSLRITSDMRVRIMYHDLYLGGKALVEKETVGLDLTKSDLCPSFVEDLTTKGMGLHVADSHTGNHREDDFTPLENIRRFLGVFSPLESARLMMRRPLVVVKMSSSGRMFVLKRRSSSI
ncbi:hypothetical protein Tco_1160046 [Tanacetum coccineum]